MTTSGDQAQITVRRRAAYTDRLRAYRVEIDGTSVGLVRPGESISIPVSTGQHSVRLRIHWCSSNRVDVAMRPGEQIFLDGSGEPSLGLLYLVFRPHRYLRLQRVG